MIFLLRKQRGTSRNAWELVADEPFKTRAEAESMAKLQSTETLILDTEAMQDHDPLGYGYYPGLTPEEAKRWLLGEFLSEEQFNGIARKSEEKVIQEWDKCRRVYTFDIEGLDADGNNVMTCTEVQPDQEPLTVEKLLEVVKEVEVRKPRSFDAYGFRNWAYHPVFPLPPVKWRKLNDDE